MKKRRKPYNSKKHQKQTMAGCRFIYDNNDQGFIYAKDRYGRQLKPAEYNAMLDKPWFWSIKLKVVAKASDLKRCVEREWQLKNEYHLSELGFINDAQTEIMLSMPTSFKFSHIEWEAKIG